MTTTPEKIAELRRLLDEAAPRPWYRTGPLAEDETGVAGGVRMGLLSEPDGDEAKQTDLIDDPKESDYDLIAAAVNALPSLLSDLKAAQKALAEIRDLAESSNATYLIEAIAGTARHALAATEGK
jgi:hypothetical protein